MNKQGFGRYLIIFGITFLATLILGGFVLTGIYVSGNKNSGDLIAEQEIIEGEERVPLQDQPSETLDEEIDYSRYGAILSDAEYMKQENIYAKEAMNPDEITLVFGGDILFDDSYAIMQNYKKRGGNITDGFGEDLISYMNRADVCMLNNEFTYTTGGAPTPNKQYTFRSKPENVSILKELGVDIVSLANNHAYDYGEVSIKDSMTTLRDAEIAYVGAGFNREEAIKPVYYIINDTKIAIVSATQIEQLDHPDTKGATDTEAGVFRCWNDDTVLDVLREAKENSDLVIFYVHWGTESTTELHWAQTGCVKDYVEAGADVIIGDHAHVLQKIDIVEGTPVIYSVGNFWFNSKERDTCLIECKVDENGLKSFRFIPCIQSDCKTTLLEGTDKTRVINYMNGLSDTVKLDEEGYLSLD